MAKLLQKKYIGVYVYDAEFVVPFSSCSRSFALKSSTFLGENIIIRVKTYFTWMMIFFQYLFLNETRCHLMTFSWWLEIKRTRVRWKRNHKFHAKKSPKNIKVEIRFCPPIGAVCSGTALGRDWNFSNKEEKTSSSDCSILRFGS